MEFTGRRQVVHHEARIHLTIVKSGAPIVVIITTIIIVIVKITVSGEVMMS